MWESPVLGRHKCSLIHTAVFEYSIPNNYLPNRIPINIVGISVICEYWEPTLFANKCFISIQTQLTILRSQFWYQYVSWTEVHYVSKKGLSLFYFTQMGCNTCPTWTQVPLPSSNFTSACTQRTKLLVNDKHPVICLLNFTCAN